MSFAQKSVSQLDYMHRLANIASTLAECNTEQCHQAANLIGEEIKSILQPAQQSAQHAGDANGCAMAAHAHGNPDHSDGGIGTTVDPVAAAVEAVKLARAIRDKAERDMKQHDQQTQAKNAEWSAANKAFSAAQKELNDAIAESVCQ